MAEGVWCRVDLIGPGGGGVTRHTVAGPGPPGLEDVEEVCRLALQAARLGGRIVLSEVAPQLRELFDLAGIHFDERRRAPDAGGARP